MVIAETKFEDKIQLNVEGRVDTVTAPDLQKAILVAFQKTKALVINLEKVQYVSSAGLRAFLIGQKTANSKGCSMTLINVNEAVMQVLQMSGFASILTIK